MVWVLRQMFDASQPIGSSRQNGNKPDDIVVNAFVRRTDNLPAIVEMFFGCKDDVNVVVELVQWAVALSADNDALFPLVWDYVKEEVKQDLPAFMAGYFARCGDELSPCVFKALRSMFHEHQSAFALHEVLQSMREQNVQLGISFIDFVFDTFCEDVDSSEVFDALATCVSQEQASQWFSTLMGEVLQSAEEQRFAAALLRSNKILPQHLPVGLLLKLSEQSKSRHMDAEVVELLHAICTGGYLTADQLSQKNEAGQDPLEILFRVCFCQRPLDEYKAITEELVQAFEAVMAFEHCPPPSLDFLVWAIDHNKIELVAQFGQRGHLKKIGIDDPRGMRQCFSVAIQKDNLAMFSTLFNSLEHPDKVLTLYKDYFLTVLGEILRSGKEEFFDFFMAVQDKEGLESSIKSTFCNPRADEILPGSGYRISEIVRYKWGSRWPFKELVEHEVYGPWVLASRDGWFWDTEEGQPQKRHYLKLLMINEFRKQGMSQGRLEERFGKELLEEAQHVDLEAQSAKFDQRDFLLSRLAMNRHLDEAVRLVMNLPNLDPDYLMACEVLHRSLRLQQSQQSKLATVQVILNSPHWNRTLMAQLCADYPGSRPQMALEIALRCDQSSQPLVNAVLKSRHCSSELWLHRQGAVGILGYLGNAQWHNPGSVLSVLQSPYASLAALTLSERGKTPLHKYIDFLTGGELSVIRLILSQVYFSPTVLDLVNDQGLTPLALLHARREEAQQAGRTVSEPRQQALALLTQFSDTHFGLQADIATPAFIGAISVSVQQGWYCLVAEGLERMREQDAPIEHYQPLLDLVQRADYEHQNVTDLIEVYMHRSNVEGLSEDVWKRVLNCLVAYTSRTPLFDQLVEVLKEAAPTWFDEEVQQTLIDHGVRSGNEVMMVRVLGRATYNTREKDALAFSSACIVADDSRPSFVALSKQFFMFCCNRIQRLCHGLMDVRRERALKECQDPKEREKVPAVSVDKDVISHIMGFMMGSPLTCGFKARHAMAKDLVASRLTQHPLRVAQNDVPDMSADFSSSNNTGGGGGGGGGAGN